MDTVEYFKSCILLLQRVEWLHNMKMTEFFVRRPWLEMPDEWLHYLLSPHYTEIREATAFTSLEHAPESLKQFLCECDRLTNFINTFHLASTGQTIPQLILTPTQKRGLTFKKTHEIERLAPLINQMCQRLGCRVVVDVGCGMGYLGQILADVYNLKVLGIDCRTEFCQKAQKRAVGKNIHYVNYTLDQDNCQTGQLERALCDLGIENPSRNCVLVTLHGCGDLQAAVYQLFKSGHFFKALISIGCCYHRMAHSAEQGFTNFPMSQCLRKVWLDAAPQFLLSPYSMRLATQDSWNRWRLRTQEEKRRHTNFVGFRALIELANQKSGGNVKKTHRRFFRENHLADFDTFLNALTDRASHSGEGLSMLNSTYTECKEYFDTIEPFTTLQSILTGVIEWMILVDRAIYLQESMFTSSICALFDPSISPRHVLICAEKCKSN